MNKFHLFLREMHIAIMMSHRNSEIIKSLSPYLVDGLYCNSISYDCIYLRSEVPLIGSLTFSSKQQRSYLGKKFINLYNYLRQYSVKGGSLLKVFRGTEVIISSSLSELKVFDFRDKKVLTIYDSLEKMETIKERKMMFSTTFCVPSTMELDKNNRYIVEMLIPHSHFDIEKAFFHICDCLYNFLSCSCEGVSFQEELYSTQCSFFANRFGHSLLLHDDVGAVMCYTHGDLWSSNVIYSGSDYYITDFERVGLRYFLFDFFFFIFTEWQLNGEGKLLDNYFAGNYDSILRRLFSIFNISYDLERKPQYFLSFLVSITFERWQKPSDIDIMIKKFIKLYIPSY